MAVLGTPSTTGASILGNAVTSFYQRTMLEWMRPNFRFYSFATKKPLPTDSGNSITWNRKVALSYGYVLSQGVPISAVKTISTNKVSALLEQIGDSVNVSDYARLTTVINTDAYALELMADQAANTVEQFIIQALTSDSNITHFVKTDASTTEGAMGRVISTGGATRLALSDIRKAVTRLQSNNAQPYDGNNFIGIVHPVQLQDLYSDTTFTGWSQIGTLVKRLARLKNFSKIGEALRGNAELLQNGKRNDYEQSRTQKLCNRYASWRFIRRANIFDLGPNSNYALA